MNPLSDNRQIKILLWLKLSQLQREELSTISYQNLVDYLFLKVWKEKLPESLNDAVSDVFSVKSEAIVAFLSRQAIIEGKKQQLGDFADLIHQ